MIRSSALAVAILSLTTAPALAERFPCPPIVFSSLVEGPWINQIPWANETCTASANPFAPVTPIPFGCQNCYTGAEPFGQPFDTAQCNTSFGPALIQTLIPQKRNASGQCVPEGAALTIPLDEHRNVVPSDHRIPMSLTQGMSAHPTHAAPAKFFITPQNFSDHFGSAGRPVVVSHPDHPGRP